ncbi:MAG: LytTR family DNA-binding domain-containing protein [Micropepsaceae bacterium]
MSKLTPVTLALGREFGIGFLYWATFLLILEPGNLLRAADAGAMPALGNEAIRILGASTLGASSTPLVLTIMRHFPIEGHRLWRNLTIHSVTNAGIALGLIVVSCVLAAWLKVGDIRPASVALPEHIASNWLLLFFCLGALLAAAHAIRFFQQARESQAIVSRLQALGRAKDPEQPFLDRVEVKARGVATMLDMSSVDWIETQGNYLALHLSGATHLLRETSVQMEAKLDPGKFVRTHRRTLVAIDRIREIRTLSSGDAELKLGDGTCIKVSRGYREGVRTALSRRPACSIAASPLG